MDVLSRELGRQKLDKEIQDALEVVRKLRTRRNTLAPISRIPTEILSRIFTTLVHSCFDDSNGADLSWIPSATAVCGHWRAIALECPSLWCFIGFKRPIWTKEMLKRSKMVPLIIHADDTYLTTEMMDAVRFAVQHLSRIRELHIVAAKDNIEKLISCIDNHTPLLKSLCLSNQTYIDSTDDMYTLPEKLFVADGHHLEQLELFDCIISWDSPLLHDLVHLTLHNSRIMAQPTIIQLLGALDRMPLLETLDLQNSLPAVSGSDGLRTLEINRIVHLSHLTTLCLSSTAAACAYLLNHITYPASTSLNFHCFFCISSDNLPTLFKAISSVWNGKDGSKLLHCLSINSQSGSVQIRGWAASGRSADRYPSSESAQIEVKLSSIIFGVQEAEEFFRALTLTNLHTLSVDFMDAIPKATWLRAFGNSTLLRSVYVRGPSAVGFVSALSTGLEENPSEDILSSDDTGKIFLPNLLNLWLNTSITHNVVFFEDFRDCLMNRCHWNVEVRKLHLECTREYYDQVELLREIVVDVDWREIRLRDDEEDEDSDASLSTSEI